MLDATEREQLLATRGSYFVGVDRLRWQLEALEERVLVQEAEERVRIREEQERAEIPEAASVIEVEARPPLPPPKRRHAPAGRRFGWGECGGWTWTPCSVGGRG